MQRLDERAAGVDDASVDGAEGVDVLLRPVQHERADEEDAARWALLSVYGKESEKDGLVAQPPALLVKHAVVDGLDARVHGGEHLEVVRRPA